MDKAVLELMGFKKKGDKNGYWYELVFNEHRFITNDNHYNENKDVWHVGYENLNNDDDIDWLNMQVNHHQKFNDFFAIVTDHQLSLNGIHKKIY